VVLTELAAALEIKISGCPLQSIINRYLVYPSLKMPVFN
jgi:hypothetical protein